MASNACVDLDEALILWNMAEKVKSLDKHSSMHPVDSLRLELIARTVPIALSSRKASCGSDSMQSLVETHFNKSEE